MNEKEILDAMAGRLGIECLNEMQLAMIASCRQEGDVILLSPTGTGKTVAYLVPLLLELREPSQRVQALVVAPSRELAVQIGEVARRLATGHKVTLCCGGHRVDDERQSLSVAPSILVGTPGRLLDHVNRRHIDISETRILVLDEFDKSLELGFHDEMRQLLSHMPRLSRRILTSATMIDQLPGFMRLHRQRIVNFLAGGHEPESRTTVWSVASPESDKLATLLTLLHNLPERSRTIIFVNHRDAAARVHQYLASSGVPAGLYHGGLDQHEREKALILFENGTHTALVATDLGSRGLDIADVAGIVHYHLPISREAYIHRNGRTARIAATGAVYILLAPGETAPDYVSIGGEMHLDPGRRVSLRPHAASIYFNAGKKEKLSRGDIVGFLANNGGISAGQIGQIALRDHYAIAAVPADEADAILERVAKLKIKGKRVKISRVQH